MWLLLTMLACGPQNDAPSTETDVTDTTDAAEITDALGDCEGADCLYRTGRDYENGDRNVIETIVYDDVLGNPRSVPIAVYRPRDPPRPTPVVLLSHGGSSGKDDPLNSMEHWAPVIAEAGYIAIAIAHRGRETADYDAVCAALGVQADIPCAIKVGWDRPHDVAAVLDWVEATEADQPGSLDLENVFLVGHSAGAGGALMIAGAKRNFRCAQPLGHIDPDQRCDAADLVSLADARVKAVVAMSPQGVDNEGFMETSYDTVDRPVLLGTGMADGEYNIGEPADRREVFTHVPVGEKYELFLDDRGAVHTLFEGATTECDDHATAARCDEMLRWVMTTALAFLDAQSSGRPEARAWLASDAIERASAGDAEWQQK